MVGVRVELDVDRVAKLEGILGADLGQIVASLVASMATQVDRAEQALQAERLQDVTQAVHQCRNDALMVGAQPLLARLNDVEHASRRGRLQETRAAMQRLREVWPETRDELQRVVHPGPNGG
jgi:HPt (histidine-containing phosphotransfer) domain-containing protein